jgi:hypothetical protein
MLVVTTECAGQVESKRLISWSAIDWTLVVQVGGEISAISHLMHPQQ